MDDVAWHLARTADAEEDAFLRTKGWSPQHEPLISRFTAQWHLERLNKLQPNDWMHYARRGMAAHGDFDLADKFYEMASERTSARTLANWYRHRVHDCELANEWQVARWYLDRLIEMGEESSDTFYQRAFAKRQMQDIEGADADEELAIHYGLRDTHIVDIAMRRAEAGDWSDASRVLSGLKDPLAALPDRSTPITLIFLHNNATAEYEAFCRNLLQTDRDNDLSPGYRSAITECCSLYPLPTEDLRQALNIAHELVVMGYKTSQLIPTKAQRLRRLSRLQKRLGDYHASLETYRMIDELSSEDEMGDKEGVLIDAYFRRIAQIHQRAPNEAASSSSGPVETDKEPTGEFSWHREILGCLRAEVSRLTK